MYPKSLKPSTMKGFTLLELIVVVMIISIVSFLVISAAARNEEKKVEILDLSTLPSKFRDAFKGQGDVELYCIKKCEECYVMQGGNISPYDGGTSFGEDVEIHLLDDDDQFVQVDDLGRIKDKKVCLRYHLYPNGSTTQMVVVNNKGTYFLPAYFGKAKKVADMQEAKELWVKEDYSLKDSGSFY